MKLAFPANANYEDVAWLLKLEYRTGASVARFRWAIDSAGPIVISGDGTYTPNNPVINISGFDTAGERLESRQWNITLADPQRTYKKTTWANNWRNRKAELWMYANGEAIHRKTGYLLQRTPTVDERDGFVMTLTYGGLIDRVNSVKKLFTNGNSQRARAIEFTGNADFVDDSADRAQESADANWGGNL